jgi:replication initiation and membrane attachment protein DnaB
LQGIPYPKPILKKIGDLLSFQSSKASQSPIIYTLLAPLTPSWFMLGEILKVIDVLFNVVGDNDYL